MSLDNSQIKLRDAANTDYIGYNLMTYNPAAIGLSDMDYWHPPIDPVPVVAFKPVPFFVGIRGHQFLATPTNDSGEWIVRRVVDGERQDFIVGTFTIPMEEAPEVFFLDNLWDRVLSVSDQDPEGWRNSWTGKQIEQGEYDAAH